MELENNKLTTFLDEYLKDSKNKTIDGLTSDFANPNSLKYVEAMTTATKNKEKFITSLTLFIAIQANNYANTNKRQLIESDKLLVEKAKELYSAAKNWEVDKAIALLSELPQTALTWINNEQINKNSEEAQTLIKAIFIFSQMTGIALNTIFLIWTMKGLKIDSNKVFTELANVATASQARIMPVQKNLENQEPIQFFESQLEQSLQQNLLEVINTKQSIQNCLTTLEQKVGYLAFLKRMQERFKMQESFSSLIGITPENDGRKNDFLQVLKTCHSAIQKKWQNYMDELRENESEKSIPNPQEIFQNLLKRETFNTAKLIGSQFGTHQNEMVDILVDAHADIVEEVAEKAQIICELSQLNEKIDRLIQQIGKKTLFLPNWLRFSFLLPKAVLVIELKQCQKLLEIIEKDPNEQDIKSINEAIDKIDLEKPNKELRDYIKELRAIKHTKVSSSQSNMDEIKSGLRPSP